MRDFLLSYDTVTLYPKHSTLMSRSKSDTSIIFCGSKFNLPVIPSNMKDVIDKKITHYLSENGYFYIHHRFNGPNSKFIETANKEKWKLISVSSGVNGESYTDLIDVKNKKLRVDFITIDVAHADHDNVKEMVTFIKKNFPETKVIGGNVATATGALYLCKLGIDAIKIGIGGGSICTTRYKTGFHLPTLQSIHDVNQMMKEHGINMPIIADGGAKHYGDISKALVFGASMVMSGGWFASCIDSPAKIENGKKIYRGSTSFEMKGQHKHIEGRKLELEEGITYEERLLEIKESLQSSISYAGGTDLTAFQNVKWGRIWPFH